MMVSNPCLKDTMDKNERVPSSNLKIMVLIRYSNRQHIYIIKLSKRLCTIASKINVTPKCVRLSEKLQLTAALVMKFDHSNKFDLCYYGQVKSQLLRSSVASKWANRLFLGVTFIFLAMVPQ